MENLTDKTKQDVQATLDSVGFKVFEDYLAEVCKDKQDRILSLLPMSIADIAEREQELGALAVLTTLVESFKQTVLN